MPYSSESLSSSYVDRLMKGNPASKDSILFLISNLHPYEISSGLRRSIEIAGVTISSFIQVFLESIEYILHSAIQLQFDMVIQHKGIVQLHIQVKKNREYVPSHPL